MLISMAVICTLFLMKLAKVNSIQSSTSIIPPRLRFSPRDFARSLAAVDYSLMLCIPRSTSTNSNISNNSKGVFGSCPDCVFNETFMRPINC
uniref:Secreted protein n=1 Tax=Meloidogyne incognita TaxID=6306 RepID=A0A914NBF7_MELIC